MNKFLYLLTAATTFVAANPIEINTPSTVLKCAYSNLSIDNVGKISVNTLTECTTPSTQPPINPPVITPPPVTNSIDPGTGVWSPPNNQNIIVFDIDPKNTRNYIPGCIGGKDWKTTNCNWEGSTNKNKIYSARMQLLPGTMAMLKWDRAESGEIGQGASDFYGAVSLNYGEISSQKLFCNFPVGAQYLTVEDQKSKDASDAYWKSIGIPNPLATNCIVPTNAKFYINFKSANENCGNANFICRILFNVNK